MTISLGPDICNSGQICNICREKEGRLHRTLDCRPGTSYALLVGGIAMSEQD
jgi:hypothetical protein